MAGCRSAERDYRVLKEQVDRGEYETTLARTQEALRQYGSRDEFWNWRLRLLEARILVSRSQGEAALSLLQSEPSSSLNSTDIPEQRKLYLGIAHRTSQYFVDAERDFADAERLVLPLPPLYRCQLLIARGNLWVDEKYYDKAKIDYRIALGLAHRDSLPFLEADSLGNLARLATAQYHFDEALDLYSTALELAKNIDSRGTAATILGDLGWGYFELGDFEASLDFYKRGAEASASSGLPVYSAYWFSGVANAQLALHQYPQAEQLARATLDHARALNNSQTITACLNTLTEVMLRTHRLVEAKQYNQEALKMEESGKDRFGTLDSLLWEGQIAIAERRFPEAEMALQRVVADPTAEAPYLWEAEAGQASLRDAQGLSHDAELLYRKSIDTIEHARGSINHDELRLSFLSSGMAVYDQYIDFLIRHNRVADALLQAELSRARTLAEGLSAQQAERLVPTETASYQRLANRLHASLLFYWIGEEHSYLWAVTPAKTNLFLLAPFTEIDPLVKSYRQALAGGRDVFQTSNAEGQKLYETLIAPAQKLIPKGSRVIVLPDASLYSLNFETLIVPDPQRHFWIEDVTISTANSLTFLGAVAARPVTKDKKLLLVGDTLPANAEFLTLSQAPKEIHLVESYFPESQRTLLVKDKATPAAYLSSNPGDYAYLHFVTHGTASRTRPLESAVILSPEGDSYKLYARDIVQHHLNAQLVTISACNGSGTRTYSGEGLVGLSWAFLRAGAHNVIGALWEVSDTASPQLMDKLYDGLTHGQDPATALRNAKLSFLHSRSPYKKPYYWAPFQLYSGS